MMLGRYKSHGEHYRNVYRTSYSRAIESCIQNGFYAKNLSAEDIELLERIRKHGFISCGSLSDLAPTEVYTFDTRRTGLLQEQEYWEKPYAREPVQLRPSEERKRRIRQRIEGEARLREAQQARAAKIQANRDMLKEARDAELKAWIKQETDRKAAAERRRAQLSEADREWEAATPSHRHYVPEWKRTDALKQKGKDARLTTKSARQIAREEADEHQKKVNAEYLRRMRKKKQDAELDKVLDNALEAEHLKKRANELENRAALEQWSELERIEAVLADPKAVMQSCWSPSAPHYPLPIPATGHMFLLHGDHVFVRVGEDVERLKTKFPELLVQAETRNGVAHFHATNHRRWLETICPHLYD